MLPEIELDQQSFEEILEDAKNQIARVYPRWTNYNEADPGITFLELFSWLKEMQQYHLDQIGEKNERKFLKLLGIVPQSVQPAEALLHISNVEKDRILQNREQFFADTIPFETTQTEQLIQARPMLLRTRCGKVQQELNLFGMEQGAEFRFLPFGTEPCVGNEFLIGFDSPLPAHHSFKLYFRIFNDYQVQRNAITDEDKFYPLARLRWEYWTFFGWKQANVVADGSHQFLQNGFVELELKEPMLQDEQGVFWLRVVLEQSWYEVPTLITGIYTNMLQVVQCNTLADHQDFVVDGSPRVSVSLQHRLCDDVKFFQKQQGGYKRIPSEKITKLPQQNGMLLAELELDEEVTQIRTLYQNGRYAADLKVAVGNGFPKQSYQVNIENILGDRLQVMVEEPDGAWYCWQQVMDFDASLPESRHYCFEESSGRLLFGDGEHGMAPTGAIYLVQAVTSEGIDGNVKQHQISKGLVDLPKTRMTNYWVATGGKQAESLQECFLRARVCLRRSQRAVTYQDYEQQVKKAAGLMIQNCRCVPSAKLNGAENHREENTVNIVVQPFSNGKREKLNEAYRQNLYALLDRCRLMGTKVRVLSPEYVGISIFAEIRIRPYYHNADRMIQETVQEFFNTAKWVFGDPVQYSTLYGVIDRLECVLSVDSLAIDAKGANINRNRSGDVLLPPNGLVYLNSVQYNLFDGE